MIRTKDFNIVLALLVFSPVLIAQNVNLTFRVNMEHENVSPDGVHVAGSFQNAAGFGSNWDPGSSSMDDSDGNGIYQLTVQVPPGTYLYKFVNGDAWGDKPELPSPECSLHDGGGNYNRQVVVGPSGTNLPAVHFDSCNAVLRLAVNMKGLDVSEHGVHVMGNFQKSAGFAADWDPSSVLMTDLNRDGTYEVSLSLPSGTYQYLFVNGITMDDIEIPGMTCTVDGGNGMRVREKEATKGGIPVATTYCFGTCDNCDPRISTDYTTEWWNDAVFYEIFVRSFYDSDGDGIGDFRGIIEKLDYLNDGDPSTTDDLGITGIWLMPMMSSPSYHGYDVMDYYATEPDYGTMEDFEALLDAAHDRGIKIIIDFVMNHASSQNPWFTQSAASQGDYRNWFIWSQNDPGFNGPWGQNVWHFRNGQYYYGLFIREMPDLNYSHPPVKEAMFDIAEFWLNKGVDGFRLDAIKYLDEDGTVLEDTPETFALLEEFRALYESKNADAVTVGEVWSTTSSVLPYIQDNRLDLCFEFDLAFGIVNSVNIGEPSAIKAQLDVVQSSYPKLQYSTFLTNHDIDRVFSTFQGVESKMKQAAAIYLTLPGVPFVYYGEEIGMTGTGAHENIRRPMQWTAGQYAGFSTVNPWQPVGGNYQARNVEVFLADENSLLNHYRSLIQLRNRSEPLRKGYLMQLSSPDEQLLAYARIFEDEAAIILSGFNTIPQQFTVSLEISSLQAGQYRLTDELSGEDFGIIELNENGGFADWQPAELINPRETWVLSLKPDNSSSTLNPDRDELIVVISPNPVSDILLVEIQDALPGGVTVQILDVQGKLRITKKVISHIVEIDVSDLIPGLYFARVASDDGQKILTFVKTE